jgi:hypothetical protein
MTMNRPFFGINQDKNIDRSIMFLNLLILSTTITLIYSCLKEFYFQENWSQHNFIFKYKWKSLLLGRIIMANLCYRRSVYMRSLWGFASLNISNNLLSSILLARSRSLLIWARSLSLSGDIAKQLANYCLLFWPCCVCAHMMPLSQAR